MSPIDDDSLAETNELTDELVAYLDGELDDERTRQIDESLARDERARGQLRLLERAWDALDELPRAEVDEQFTCTTVEMIALEATEDLEREQEAAPRKRRRWWLAAAACLALSTGLGYAISRGWDPNGNDQLARDLPLLEHLDEYRQIDDLAFLEQLLDEQVFDEPVSSNDQ